MVGVGGGRRWIFEVIPAVFGNYGNFCGLDFWGDVVDK